MPNYISQANHPSQSRFNDGDMADAYRRNPLAADVRYWGHWMLEKARQELAEFYPPDPDGSVPVAYLWSRTIPCPNCDAEMPLIRQYWLARKDKKKVALEPVIDRKNNRVDFKVVKGDGVTGDPAEATTSKGDTKCLLCEQVVKAAYIRESGRQGKMSATPTTVVLDSNDRDGKSYRADTVEDTHSYAAAAARLGILQAEHQGTLSLVPDEPIDQKTLGLRVDAFGLKQWSKLFNARQLLSLTVFTELIREAAAAMAQEDSMDKAYQSAVILYLAFAVSRLADYNSSLVTWAPHGEYVGHTFTSQKLAMIWDYCEVNSLSGSTGSFGSALNWIHTFLSTGPVADEYPKCIVKSSRASEVDGIFQAIITDPPYYNSIDYAGLSDFFYVWFKRSLYGEDAEGLFSLPLTPKRDQAIMASELDDVQEKARYVSMMAEVFASLHAAQEAEGIFGIVFAHTDSDAWATLIEGLLTSQIVPVASWPIDTELQNKTSAASRANLKTSVWMSCRKREGEAPDAFLSDVMEEMRPVIRERLLYFWGKGIRGADFFISAIGPALSVFGRHSRVLRPSGEAVTVREFLDIVRRESTGVALEQVLHGADLGVVDPITRQYVTWVWSYSRAPLEAGEAIALCLATGASYNEATRPSSIAIEMREKSKKMVRLRTIRQRAMDDDDLGNGHAARPTPLIDQLQHTAWLWSQNLTDRLAAYRGQLGETRWAALRTLGQAVAECLPDGDEDRRIILGLLGSNVMAAAPQPNGQSQRDQRAGAMLPGFESEDEHGTE